jgi:hypothetical protein
MPCSSARCCTACNEAAAGDRCNTLGVMVSRWLGPYRLGPVPRILAFRESLARSTQQRRKIHAQLRSRMAAAMLARLCSECGPVGLPRLARADARCARASNGLKSDIAPSPLCANRRPRRCDRFWRNAVRIAGGCANSQYWSNDSSVIHNAHV